MKLTWFSILRINAYLPIYAECIFLSLSISKSISNFRVVGLYFSFNSNIKINFCKQTMENQPGRVAQLVTCLATDACLTADPGVASSIPVQSHTFVELDHEIIYTVILLPSADLFKKGCCQLQAKVCARITG